MYLLCSASVSFKSGHDTSPRLHIPRPCPSPPHAAGALITAMDTLRLNQLEVDAISPFLRAAVDSLNKHTWLGADFEPKAKLLDW